MTEQQTKDTYNTYHREYYHKNKEKIRLKQREQYLKHREKRLAYDKEYYNKTKEDKKLQKYLSVKRWRLNNPERYLYNTVKNRAKKSNLEFDLDITDIVIPTHCKYLGIELKLTLDPGHKDEHPSVDRIDNTKGYTKDNIQIISFKANRMKTNSSITELLDFAKNIIKIHG